MPQASASTSSRITRACCRCRAGGFPDAVAEIRKRLGDLPLLLAGMVGSNRGWKEAPYVPCPAGIDELVEQLVWVGEREAIVPGVSYVGDGRADVMRGRGGAAARRGRGRARSTRWGWSAIPGTHNKWATLRHGKIQQFPDGHDRRAVQPAQGSQHPCRPAAGEGRGERCVQAGGAATRSTTRRFRPTCSESARSVLLGQAKKEDAASYTSGLLIGADVRIGLAIPDRRRDPRDRPARAHAPLRRGDRARRGATADRARRRDNASSPAFRKSRRGST